MQNLFFLESLNLTVNAIISPITIGKIRAAENIYHLDLKFESINCRYKNITQANKTLVTAIATQPELYEKILSNIKEVKARGAKVFVITNEGNEAMEKEADFVFYLPETAGILTPSLTVVPLQLFSYYVAVNKGCDVDKPRNLAKSVTVE